MSIVTLPGSVFSALTHFALLGSAAIWEDSGGRAALSWTKSRIPQPQLSIVDGDAADLADAVHRHSIQHAEALSWVQHTHLHEGRSTGTFSPRIKKPADDDAWQTLQRHRHLALDQLTTGRDHLDLRMIAGLGEPAYWGTASTSRGDDGASRWEMKTRNKGEEFVGQRLAPLASAVAKRSTDQVLAGLTGATIIDEHGKNSPTSRTSTGLAQPGPVDKALPWCALWGISQFPVIHHADRQSTTPAAEVPQRRTHPVAMHLPVSIRPLTTARVRTLLLSRHLLQGADIASVEFGGAATWLRQRGVAAIATFSIHVTDNPSAPERQVLEGVLNSTASS